MMMAKASMTLHVGNPAWKRDQTAKEKKATSSNLAL